MTDKPTTELIKNLTLSGQVALVTGASRGIGQAIAMTLARAGAQVIGTATSDAGAAKITEYFAASGLAGRGVCLNVTDAAGCEALIDAISKKEGSVAILVNNAGITRDNLALRMKDEDWSAVIDTNLSAVFRMSRLVMRGMMKARSGRIINITSVVGSMGNAGQANYAASKAGVAGMTRALARELGSRNITVNCIAPGFIDTDMTRALNPEQITGLTQQIPLGRLGEPKDIAETVSFLASGSAGYITGVTLHVNGGMYMD
jgi:3-oxoacyl-[acyl-carrier protein] reductase